MRVSYVAVINVLATCFSVYEDDFEVDDDAAPTSATISSQLDRMSLDNSASQSKASKQQRPRAPSPESDIYDFSTSNLGY